MWLTSVFLNLELQELYYVRFKRPDICDHDFFTNRRQVNLHFLCKFFSSVCLLLFFLNLVSSYVSVVHFQVPSLSGIFQIHESNV